MLRASVVKFKMPATNIQSEDLARINVVGVSGSGKSWLSKRLAGQLGAPRVELDQLFWGPNWTESEIPTFRDKVEAAVQSESWVLDGNYHSKTKDIKWRDVKMVVWVDNSLPRTLWQALTRAIKRIRTQEELWPGTGNRETFRRTFLSTDSILLWTIRMFYGVRRRYSQIEKDHSAYDFRFVRLRGHNAVNEFLCEVKKLA